MTQRSFSVIIPTRERADTLAASLRTVVCQDYENLEIIVSDNCSEDNTRKIVESFDDDRIKYINTGRRLSMSENWEFALAHVSNDWLTIIGDDDALLPNCFHHVNRIADETQLNAIRSTTCAYQWPNRTLKSQGRLLIPMRSGYSVRNSSDWLKKVLCGKARYPVLPMLYNGGFVSMDAIRAVMSEGKLYHSCIPDVYSAVVLSNTLELYAFSHEPLAINGASKHSTGSSQFSPDPEEKKAALKFQMEGNIPFHPSIPLDDDGSYPQSLYAMVYECCAQAAEFFPNALTLSPEEQAQVVLATAGSLRPVVERWVEKFCTLNDLNFDQIAAVADREAKSHRLQSMLERLRSCADIQILSKAGGIEDVYEASLTAHAVMQSKPSLPARVTGRITAKLRVMLQP